MFLQPGPPRGAQRHGADVQRGTGAPEAGHARAERREEQPEGCAQRCQRAGTGSQVLDLIYTPRRPSPSSRILWLFCV